MEVNQRQRTEIPDPPTPNGLALTMRLGDAAMIHFRGRIIAQVTVTTRDSDKLVITFTAPRAVGVDRWPVFYSKYATGNGQP